MNISIQDLANLTSVSLNKHANAILDYIDNFPVPIRTLILDKISREPMLILSSLKSPIITIPFNNVIPHTILDSLRNKYKLTSIFQANIGIPYATIQDVLYNHKDILENSKYMSYLHDIIRNPFYDYQSIIAIEKKVSDLIDTTDFNRDLIPIVNQIISYRYDGFNLIHNKISCIGTSKFRIKSSVSILSMLNLIMSTQITQSSDITDCENLVRMFIIYTKILGIDAKHNMGMIKRFIKIDNMDKFDKVYTDILDILVKQDIDMNLSISNEILSISDKSVKESLLFAISNEERVELNQGVVKDGKERFLFITKVKDCEYTSLGIVLSKILDNQNNEILQFLDTKYWDSMSRIDYDLDDNDIGHLMDSLGKENVFIVYDNMTNRSYTLAKKDEVIYLLFKNKLIKTIVWGIGITDADPRNVMQVKIDPKFTYEFSALTDLEK